MFKREASSSRGGEGSSSSVSARTLQSSSAVPSSYNPPISTSLDSPLIDLDPSSSSWYSLIMSPHSLWVLLGLGLAGGIVVYIQSRRNRISQDLRVFIRRLQLLPPPPPASPAAPHPLSGLTFAISDGFDVADFITGFGSPDWERTHGPASCTASVVLALVQAGATCIGKTHMDEMGYGITGINKHYGTLVNPGAASHVPGGSSSGSAAAVASGIVDFSFGTDTCGGVRIPAAYCGILGFRPSHGTVSCSGMVSVSQSLDTAGWFARDLKVLLRIGQVVLRQSDVKQVKRVYIADDCFNLVSLSEIRNRQLSVAINTFEKEFGIQVTRFKIGEHFASKLQSLKMSLVCFRVDGESGKVERGLSALTAVKDACQLLQRHEFKMNHDEWIQDSGSGVSEHLKNLETDPDLVSHAMKVKNEARIAMNELLMSDGLLVIPTAPGPPPKLRTKDPMQEDFQDRAYTLSSLASMSGCCQVSIPMGKYDGCPTAISLLAKHGADRFLLEAANKAFQGLQREPETLANGTIHEEPKVVRRPDAAEAAKEKGNAAFKKKDFRLAIKSYTEAIKYDEGNATYYSNRAAAYLAMYNHHRAEADCSKAIELDKKNVKAYLRRATAREYLGFYRDADDDYRQALVLEPTNKAAQEGVKKMKKLIFE